jgi:hypothetical protein
MLGHFTALRASRHFPLEVAFGAISFCPERIPYVTAFADPADILQRLESAFGQRIRLPSGFASVDHDALPPNSLQI